MLFRLVFASTFFTAVAGHGFLYSPVDTNAQSKGVCRGIGQLDYQIDSLRNPIKLDNSRDPNIGGEVCRGESRGNYATSMTLTNGQQHTISLAISERALHKGDCYAYILDGNGQNPVLIGKATDAEACGWNGHCDKVNSATLDMCLVKWTFTVQNADKINCKNCILQWKWVATHLAPSYEHFENCADVTLDNVAAQKQSLPQSQPTKPAQPSQQYSQDNVEPAQVDPKPAQEYSQQETKPIASVPKQKCHRRAH